MQVLARLSFHHIIITRPHGSVNSSIMAGVEEMETAFQHCQSASENANPGVMLDRVELVLHLLLDVIQTSLMV